MITLALECMTISKCESISEPGDSFRGGGMEHLKSVNYNMEPESFTQEIKYKQLLCSHDWDWEIYTSFFVPFSISIFAVTEILTCREERDNYKFCNYCRSCKKYSTWRKLQLIWGLLLLCTAALVS